MRSTASGENSFEVVSPKGKMVGLWGEISEGGTPYEPRQIVYSGSYDEVLEHFDDQLWADGLPIVPPTISRVEQMLAFSTRDPAEVIGAIGDQGVEATVWNTAVNAVMAGCRDEDFPIVLAVTEILADPSFRIRDAGSTTSWEALVVLSGPNLPDRGFNVGTGVMRLGRRANSSIGRFTRMWIRNIACMLIPPGYTDMAAIGQSFYVAMAESDDATDGIGWPTSREEWGFHRDDLVVAVQGIVGTSVPIYSAGGSVTSHLRQIGEAIAGCSGHLAGTGANTGRWAPLLAMSPAIAEVFARAGMTKDELRRQLAGYALVPVSRLVDGVIGIGGPGLDLAQRVRDGVLSPRYHESDDPDRLVPAILVPADLAIVVTGNPGRNQSRYYIPLGHPGQRMVRRVDGATTGR